MSFRNRGEERIVRLDIADIQALHAAYLPFMIGGGLFVEAAQLAGPDCELGTAVVLQVSLSALAEQLTIDGRVAWICPLGAQRPAGIGVQFTQASGESARQTIEALLMDHSGDGQDHAYPLDP